MHERTFIVSMLALDLMFIAAGGVVAWGRAVPRLPGAGAGRDPITAVMMTLLTTVVGAWILHELNVFAFELAESRHAHRNARWVALAFIVATVLGSAAGMAAG